MSSSERLKGKTALLSGAASGIGLASAWRFAEEGAKIAVSDIAAKKGRELVAALNDNGYDAFFFELDVVDAKSWEGAVAETVGRWGKLDILLNSAGIGRVYPLLDMTLEEWRRTMAVNLDGTFLGTQAAIRSMKDTGGGSIVNISSVMGMVGAPNISAYCASKGGVRLFTKAAALECAALGLDIRINSVHPGYIETPMVMRRFENIDDSDAAMTELTTKHPIGRLGQKEEVASLILYLASDESRFTTGSEFVIDGGYTAR
ncbi:MAG: 3-beta hydroxysteroid dehydrogenase [Sneathiella sp.]|nr:MAG: 3-beta hydroxysteroid dehydrogenase [Sneathiella sp.]